MECAGKVKFRKPKTMRIETKSLMLWKLEPGNNSDENPTLKPIMGTRRLR